MQTKLQEMPDWLVSAKPDMLCVSKDIFGIFGYKTTNSLTSQGGSFPAPDFKKGDHLLTGNNRKVLFRHNYWKAETVRQEYFRRRDLAALMARPD